MHAPTFRIDCEASDRFDVPCLERGAKFEAAVRHRPAPITDTPYDSVSVRRGIPPRPIHQLDGSPRNLLHPRDAVCEMAHKNGVCEKMIAGSAMEDWG